MALTTITTSSGRGGLLSTATTTTKAAAYASLPLPLRRHAVFPNPTTSTTTRTARTSHVTTAKKLSSRTGRFDSKNRRSNTTTKEEQDEIDESTATIDYSVNGSSFGGGIGSIESNGAVVVNSEGVPMPKLPGLEQNLWEGPQWDGFGFFVQYMWAFGIGFALIACGVAVSTYNEGATDFKETPAYKDSIGSSNLLEEPEASKSDVFESNPTEDAPSLE